MTANTLIWVIWGIIAGLFVLVVFDASGSGKWKRREYVMAAGFVGLVWVGIYLI